MQLEYQDAKAENRRRITAYLETLTEHKVPFYPAYLQVEQTSRCNAECIMCNHFYLGNRGYADISEPILEKLTPILPYCETVMLNGDGEPFLSPTIVSSIERYHQYGVRIGTNTNLSCLPEPVIPYLSKAFGFLNISCDGCTAQTYEMIREGLSFETFRRNLAVLEQRVPELPKFLDCVVMKQNLMELPGIVRLAHAYGVGHVKFERLGVNPMIGNEADRPEYDFALLQSQLAAAMEEGERCGVTVSAPSYTEPETCAACGDARYDAASMAAELRVRKETASGRMASASLRDDYYSERATAEDLTSSLWEAGKLCRWAVERCYIDLHGNVTTCCFNMKKNFGSLAEQSFEEIWNGEAYVLFREQMAGHRLPDFCRQCNWIKESRF